MADRRFLDAPHPERSGQPAGVPQDGQPEVGMPLAPGAQPTPGAQPGPGAPAAAGGGAPAGAEIASVLGASGEEEGAPGSGDSEAAGVGLMDILGLVGAEPDYDEMDLTNVVQAVDAVAELLRDDPIPVPADSLILKPDDDVRQVFDARLTESAGFREVFERRWLRNEADYHQIVEGDSKKWRTRVAIPYTYSQINTWVPLCTSAVFDSGSYIWDMVGLTKQGEKRGRALKTYMEYAARVKMSMPRKMRDGFWYSGLYGLGIWRAGWRRCERLIRAMKMEDLGNGLQGARLEVRAAVTADHPDLVHVNPWNWFPCPFTRNADQDIPYALERVEATVDELTEWANSGRYGTDGQKRILAWLEKRNSNGVTAETTMLSRVTSRIDAMMRVGINSPYKPVDAQGQQKDPKRLPVIVWEMWTREYVCLIANDGERTVLAKCANPFIHGDLPYTTHSYDRIPGLIYGRGIGDVVSPIQRLVNFIYNHAQETAMLRRNAPMLAKRAGSALRSPQFELRPGIVIDVKDVKDVAPFPIPEVMKDTILQEQHLLMHADKATGLNDLLKGFEPATKGGTATEASLLTSLTRQRQTAHVKEIRETMGRLGRLFVALCQQYLRTDQLVHVAGADGLEWSELKVEDIIGEWDVVPSASFVKSNATLLQSNIVALLPLISQDPMVKHDALLKYVFKVFEIEKPEDLVIQPPPEPMDPLLEQIALRVGEEVPPSPGENPTVHLATHIADLKALLLEPVKNLPAINATRRHVRATIAMLATMGVDAAALFPEVNAFMGGGLGADSGAMAGAMGGSRAGPPAPNGPRPGVGGGGEMRQGATALGKAQGSYGPPGRAPGPAGVPKRRERVVA